MSASADDILFSNIKGNSSTGAKAVHTNFSLLSRDIYENSDEEWQEPVSDQGEYILLVNGVTYDAIIDPNGRIEDYNHTYDDLQTYAEYRACDDIQPVATLYRDTDQVIWMSPSRNQFFLIEDDFGSCPVHRVSDLLALLLSNG